MIDMLLNSYSYTSKGGRNLNEDSVKLFENRDSGIYIVADGLGGHSRGEVASECVASSLLAAWGREGTADMGQWLRAQIALANEKLLKMQRDKGCTMKSTVVVLIIEGRRAAWANTGDSRLYYIHDGRLARFTEDHSVSYKKYKAGLITREQLNTDEDQSFLLKALGGGERWEPDITEYEEDITPGDAFLLCSDGLWEYLYDEEILTDCLMSSSAEDWAKKLLQRADNRIKPGNDNLSLVTVWHK